MNRRATKHPPERDETPASDDAAAGEDVPLYRDPFAGDGPCRLALAVPEEQRAAVTQTCPRCGARQGPYRDLRTEPRCLLEGLELDLMALERAQNDPA